MSKLLRGVTVQLLLLTVLPLTVILGVISFASIAMHQDAMRRLVSDRDIRAVVATAGSIGAIVQHKTDTLQLVAEGSARQAQLSPQAGITASILIADIDVINEFPGGIALYSQKGTLIASTSAAAQWARTGATIFAFSSMTGTVGSRISVWNNALVILAQDRDRSVTAVGLVPLDTLQLNELVNPPSDSSAVNAFLFNTDGQVLASTQPSRLNTDVRDHPGVGEALRGQSGGLFRPDPISGDEHVVSYAPVITRRGPTGLGVIIEEPWQTVLDPLMRYSLAMPLITLPVLLLAALAVTFGVRRIVQPLQQLDQQAREIGQGHYDVLQQPVRGIEEVEQLQETLRAMARQIQVDQERLRNYAHAVTETQEAERKRLARELHDDTIQSLIVLSQRIQMMRQAASHDPSQIATKLDELRRTVLQMIEDIRRFSRALRPIYLEDAGLVAALERLTFETNESAQRDSDNTQAIQVTFSTSTSVPRYKPEVELALYRIAQEALTNALRHASASRISITLSTQPGWLQLCVEDDGRGFSGPATGHMQGHSQNSLSVGGFGLMGIRERASLIGAQVDIHSEPGAGTRITILYPDAA